MAEDLRDKRRWQVTKEIPLSLVFSMCGMLILGGMGYQSLKDDVRARADSEMRLTGALEETNKELRVLASEYRQGAVPAAEIKWRLQLIEQTSTETRNQVSDHSRRLSAIEARIRVGGDK